MCLSKGVLALLLGFACLSPGDTLENPGFETGDLSCWTAQMGPLNMYASGRETYTRNRAARLHGDYSSVDGFFTNSLRQCVQAMPGDRIMAEGFVYWRKYTQTVGVAESKLRMVFEGASGEQTVAWTAPHMSWTYFAFTGSVFGLSHGGFEGGSLGGWMTNPDALQIAIETNLTHGGAYACRFSGAWRDWSFSNIKQHMELTNTATLEARAQVYIGELATDGDWLSVGLELKRREGGPIQEVTLGPDAPRDEWLPLSITLPATATGEYSLRVFVAGGSNGTNSTADVVVDDVRLWEHGGTTGECLHVLGVADNSDLDFLQSGYSSESLDLDVVGADAFPKELNLYSRTKQFFHFSLSEQQCAQGLLFVLNPRWCSGSGALTVALEFWNGEEWEEADRTAVSGDVDGELLVPSGALQPGHNPFRFKALEGSAGTDVVTWDQILIYAADRTPRAYDVGLRMEYVGRGGGDAYEGETEVFLDCCRIAGSTAGIAPPEYQLDVLKEQALQVVSDDSIEIEPQDFPPKKSYGYVGGSDPLNYPGYVEIQMPGWAFGALRSITNEITTTAAMIIYELPYEGDGYIEFDQFGYCDRYWSEERYAPVDVQTNAPYFTLGVADNRSDEFGDGPFPAEHNYYVGTSLQNFPKRLSTVEGDGWPNRLNVIYPEDYSKFGSGRDKYYTIATVTTNGPDCNIKTVKINTYVTGAGVPEVNVESREYHMGWAERDEALGMVDYPNVTYQERYAAADLRDRDKRMLDEDGWYMQQLVRGSNTADPMELYTYDCGNWMEEIYHECDFMWANAGSGVRSIFDEDHVKRLDGQVSYHVGFRVGHFYEPDPGEGGYDTHLISLHGSGYLRMTDYEAYMAGSFRPFAHDPFGLYKYDEDFPVIPRAYSRLVKGDDAGTNTSYMDILLPFQSETDNRMIGVGHMKLHMEPEEVRDTGAYFDMQVDLWAKNDVVITNHAPLNCFAQSDMFWRGSTNINDGTEAHDLDVVMIHRTNGDWITHELHNSPENVQVHELGDFQNGDVLYLMQQDRGSDSYGFDPGGSYRKVTNFEITMLENNGLPTGVDVFVDNTVSEYSDNVVIACPIRRDVMAGEHLQYSYRYRAVFAPGVRIQNPNVPDGGDNWSNQTYRIDFLATDGNHSLQANIYYGSGRDDDWTLINPDGAVDVPQGGAVSYAWDVSGVSPGAYYIKVEAWRTSGGKTGFDVSNTRLQVGAGRSFVRDEPVVPVVTTNAFRHLGSNMGFERGNVLGWASLADHLTIYADGTAGCEGQYAARIHGRWSGWSWNNLQQDIPCRAGEVLRVKGRVYIGELKKAASDWVACGIKMESCALPGRTSAGVEFNASSVTGRWLHVDFERVAPVDGYDRLVLWVGGTHCAGADVYFDRIEVTTSDGSEVVTNRPAAYWQNELPVDVSQHTALRMWLASANRGENVQVWASDASGQTNMVDLTHDLVLSELPKQVVIPWQEFFGIDLTQLVAVGLHHAYDSIGIWHVRSVSDPVKVTTRTAASSATDLLGLPHFNPGETVTNTITLENMTAESVSVATLEVIQEYGEDRYWVDTSYSPWVDSLVFQQGDRLAGDAAQCWSNLVVPAYSSIDFTNTYELPMGKRIDSTRHWIDQGLDWFAARNHSCRARVHAVVRGVDGHTLYADAKTGWYSIDDDFDFDDDGLPDSFESALSGCRTNANSQADDDADGYSNEQEFIAGTRPDDAASLPVSTGVRGEIPAIRVDTCEGREYWLEWTDDLRDPDWDEVDDSRVRGDNGVHLLMDDEADDQRRYYRTGVRWHHSAWPL